MAKVLCDTCKKFTDFTTSKRVAIRKVGEKEIAFREKYAICSCCGNEYYFPGFDVENEREFESVYNGLKGCGLA